MTENCSFFADIFTTFFLFRRLVGEIKISEEATVSVALLHSQTVGLA